MRAITDHQINILNKNIKAEAGPAGPGGMPVAYNIAVLTGPNEHGAHLEVFHDLRFQSGSPAECINGIFNEVLLVVLIDRLRGAQGDVAVHGPMSKTAGDPAPFRCRENAIALTHLEEALMWLQKRSRERAARGVEGQQVP